MKYVAEGRWLHIETESLFVKTIQEFFDSYIPSRKIQHLLIQNKHILMDGNPVKREDDIAGLRLSICIYPEECSFEKASLSPDIVYEDEIMAIVNKPKDLLVHSDGSGEMTLTRIMQSYYSDRDDIDPLPIHRLDRETSGLVIYSKSPVFQPLLDKLLSEKQIRRNYLAFVHGIMEAGKTMTIDKPIGNDRHNANKKVIYRNGQNALTKVRSLGCSRSKNYSVLYCSLETGRTHQIRLHLSSVSYPILNDPLYGRSSDLCIRMGLFADNIEMYHPLKEDSLSIDCELPNDLQKLYMQVLK